jgi:ribosomal protein L11 methylase PrmA
MSVTGSFDWSPTEETAPIYLLERLAVCFGDEVEAPPEPVFTIRLHKHIIFGTGGHPATRAAVWAMASVASKRFDGVMPSPFLELGATTGLLALVAAYGGAEDVHFCSDSIESQALADDNGMLNGHDLKISEALEFFGMWHYVREKELVCEPRVAMFATQTGGCNSALNYLPDVYDSILPGGVAVWAGHTAKQHRAIEHRLGEFFELVEVFDFEGWPCFICTKKK